LSCRDETGPHSKRLNYSLYGGAPSQAEKAFTQMLL